MDGLSWVQVPDPDLDLAAQLERTETEVDPPLVPPGPRLVAGQGESSMNLTVVRILNRYGIAELQFLAYPTSVTGGVRVAAGRIFPPDVQIVAVPFSATNTREIRIFREDGVLRSVFAPASELDPPFVVAVGDFLEDVAGEEIAVTSRHAGEDNRRILLYDGDGVLRKTTAAPAPWQGATNRVEMSVMHVRGPDVLLLAYHPGGRLYALEPDRGLLKELAADGLPSGFRPWESAFADERVAAGAEEPLLSTLWTIDDAGNIARHDVGRRENLFRIHPIDPPRGEPVYTFDSHPQGWYAKSSSCIAGYESGALVLRVHDGSPFDPYILGPVADYDGDVLQEFAMSLTVSGGPAGTFTGAVFWYPEGGGVGRAAFSLHNGTQVVRLNLPANATPGMSPHEGVIARLRLDLPDGGTWEAFRGFEARVDWVAVSDDPLFAPPPPTDPWSEFVRPGTFRHIRTDAASPGYSENVDFDNEDYDHWAGGSFLDFIERTQAEYALGLPSVWEPTASHRQFIGTFDAWHDAVDPDTGLPRFTALTRLDRQTTYGEGDSRFYVMTWAPDVAPLERLIVWPLREYLRRLAPKFRGTDGDPSRLAALEPNHEFEIYVADDETIGDYNPAMIDGFYDHLLRRYTTLAKVNSRHGTSFAGREDFDPPRNLGRGAWDAYDPSNPFYNAWVEYERRVVNLRIAQGMRESLLAGFPPEIIKTHQIPADYAVGDVLSGRRITPIAWSLAAGTGYGGTRYGIWYDRARNWIQGSFSSGLGLVSIGEYHPHTASVSAAEQQIRYVFEHGVSFVHHMTWDDAGWNETARAAYESLAADGVPRPGVTGGVGPVRAVVRPAGARPEQRYNIVQVGAGASRTGLLKSVRQDGSWEGTVYVVPFHARIDVEAVVEGQSWRLTTTQFAGGPVAGLMPGDRVEIRFRARTDDPDGRFTLLVLHDGIELAGTRSVVAVGDETRFYRYVLRIQNPMDDVLILINSGERDTPSGFHQEIELQDFSMLVHRERVARYEYGVDAGTPHAGGVSFDILSRDDVPVESAPSPFPVSETLTTY